MCDGKVLKLESIASTDNRALRIGERAWSVCMCLLLKVAQLIIRNSYIHFYTSACGGMLNVNWIRILLIQIPLDPTRPNRISRDIFWISVAYESGEKANNPTAAFWNRIKWQLYPWMLLPIEPYIHTPRDEKKIYKTRAYIAICLVE
jgi:hypothetical protein